MSRKNPEPAGSVNNWPPRSRPVNPNYGSWSGSERTTLWGTISIRKGLKWIRTGTKMDPLPGALTDQWDSGLDLRKQRCLDRTEKETVSDLIAKQMLHSSEVLRSPNPTSPPRLQFLPNIICSISKHVFGVPVPLVSVGATPCPLEPKLWAPSRLHSFHSAPDAPMPTQNNALTFYPSIFGLPGDHWVAVVR